MNYLKTTAAAFMVCLCFSASAQQQSTTYRVNLFVPAKNNAKVPDLAEITQATSALESLLGKRGRVTKQIGLLPSPLPAIPGSVSYKTIALGPQRVQILVCSDAYADLSIQSDTSGGAFGGSGEKHSGCVYPSAAGIRASYVVERYTRALGGVAGALFGGIRNSIQGDDSEWGNKLVTNAISHFKTNMPEALIESIEGPGTNAISTNFHES